MKLVRIVGISRKVSKFSKFSKNGRGGWGGWGGWGGLGEKANGHLKKYKWKKSKTRPALLVKN